MPPTSKTIDSSLGPKEGSYALDIGKFRSKRNYFAAVYEDTKQQLYLTALKWCGNEQDAEDIVQDASERFIRYSVNLKLSKDPVIATQSMRKYLNKILYSTFVNKYRANKKYQGQSTIDDLPEMADPKTNVERDYTRSAIMDRVMDILYHSPEIQPEFKEVLQLNVIDERTYNEIAEITNIPVGTVKSRVFRSREKLVAALEKEGITVDKLILEGIL